MKIHTGLVVYSYVGSETGILTLCLYLDYKVCLKDLFKKIIRFRREKAALELQELRVSQSDTVSGNLDITPTISRSESYESLGSDHFTHL